MAKAKDPAKEQKKMLIASIKKTIKKNGVLPVLETVWLTGKEAVMTDLENDVVIPYATEAKNVCLYNNKLIDVLEMMDTPKMTVDKDFGCEFSEGKRKIKVLGENPDNFPMISMYNKHEEARGDQPYNEIGKLGENEMTCLKIAQTFMSNDDLRPAMTGVYFDIKDKVSRIVATDAHRMFWRDVSTFKEGFILPPKAVSLLLHFGGNWTVTSDSHFEMKDGKIVIKQPTKKEIQPKAYFEEAGHKFCGDREKKLKIYEQAYKTVYESFHEFCLECCIDDEDCFEQVEVPDLDKQPGPIFKEATHVMFTREDGVKVISRVIDARFPDYRVVVPPAEDVNAKMITDREFLLRELKNAGRFANRSTNQVMFTLNGCVSVHSSDIDFSEEYDYEFSPGEAEAHFKGFNQKLQPNDPRPEPISIAFNGKMLSEIIHHIPADEPVTLKVISPTKAGLINEGFLLMPLMLNQD